MSDTKRPAKVKPKIKRPGRAKEAVVIRTLTLIIVLVAVVDTTNITVNQEAAVVAAATGVTRDLKIAAIKRFQRPWCVVALVNLLRDRLNITSTILEDDQYM